MDVEQEVFRKSAYQAIDKICENYYNSPSRPVVSKVKPGYLRQLVPPTPPESGEAFEAIADDYQNFIVPGITNWQHPSFFGYFPTACTFEGILGDLYSASVSNPGFNWSSSPACTELEAIVMDWAAHLLGLSPVFYNASRIGGGAIQNTASDSALIAIVAARTLYTRNRTVYNFSDLVIYTTTQTHSLGAKAALILGLSVRAIEVTPGDNFALRGEALKKALEEDGAAGRKPFVLIATLGTTSSGAIDNLREIGEVARDYTDLWIHVDAAWAGVALACPEYREVSYLDAINTYAHSFCTNFHKWGLTNFDASTLWVRDRSHLTGALDVTPPFLRSENNDADAGTVIDYRNWHLALGRRFRSIKLWFVLRSFGVEGFRKYIRRTIALNQMFASLIDSSPYFELVTPPSFALTVFRLIVLRRETAEHPDSAPSQFSDPALHDTNTGVSAASIDALNKLFYARLSARDDILLTQTVLNGAFCIRLAVGSARTDESHIRRVFDVLQEEGRETLMVIEKG